jgi:hypothetical protein
MCGEQAEMATVHVYAIVANTIKVPAVAAMFKRRWPHALVGNILYVLAEFIVVIVLNVWLVMVVLVMLTDVI